MWLVLPLMKKQELERFSQASFGKRDRCMVASKTACVLHTSRL